MRSGLEHYTQMHLFTWGLVTMANKAHRAALAGRDDEMVVSIGDLLDALLRVSKQKAVKQQEEDHELNDVRRKLLRMILFGSTARMIGHDAPHVARLKEDYGKFISILQKANGGVETISEFFCLHCLDTGKYKRDILESAGPSIETLARATAEEMSSGWAYCRQGVGRVQITEEMWLKHGGAKRR